MVRRSVALSLVILCSGLVFAEDIQETFLFDGRFREYLLHVPPSYDGSEAFPLVINLHWGDGTPQGMVSFCGMNSKADEEGFFIVYPAGTIIPAGFTCWNAGPCFETEVDDVGFISALIDTLASNYNLDTLRIYATGFCGGAMMVHRLACELSSRLAAVAPVMGSLVVEDWNSCNPERLIPILHIHARNDPSVPYYGRIWPGVYDNYYWAPIDSVMNHWADVLGCSQGPDTFVNDEGALRQTWTRADDSSLVVFWTTEDDDQHRWPGTFLGSQQIVANDVIWEFFDAHPIPTEEPEPAVEELSDQSPRNNYYMPDVICRSGSVVFSLKKAEHVQIQLFDVTGREISSIYSGVAKSGLNRIDISACDLEAGAYFLRIFTPLTTETVRFLLLE